MFIIIIILLNLFSFECVIYAVRFGCVYKKIIVVQKNNRTKGLISTARYNGDWSCLSNNLLQSKHLVPLKRVDVSNLL